MTVAPPPVTPDPTSVNWTWDSSKPQETVTVPLRVVMVGFKPGRARRGEAPRPGPELPAARRPDPARQVEQPRQRGLPSSAPTRSSTTGARTTTTPSRSSSRSSTAGSRRCSMRPTTFTTGLFSAMAQNSSTTGEYSDSRTRTYLEKYNADSRRLPRRRRTSSHRMRRCGSSTARRPRTGSPRTRRRSSAGTRDQRAASGTGPGTPGYTVFILNTWDSPEALAIAEAAARVPRLQDRPHRPRHRPVRRYRLGAGLGRQLPRHDGRPRRRPEPVRVGDLGQPAPLRARLGCTTTRRCGSTARTRRGRSRAFNLADGVGRRRSRRARPGTRTSSNFDLGRTVQRGDLVPVRALLPLRAAAVDRPVLLLEQRLARRVRGRCPGRLT